MPSAFARAAITAHSNRTPNALRFRLILCLLCASEYGQGYGQACLRCADFFVGAVFLRTRAMCSAASSAVKNIP